MSEWKEYKLEELGTLQRGKSKYRPRYAFHLYGGHFPFIQTGQIKEANKYITEYEQTYSEAGVAQSKLWPRGTLCITIAANIAEIAILSLESCFPDSIIGFIPDETKCNLDFVFYTLKYFKKELQQMGDGSVQDNINLGTFKQIKFPFPELPTQYKIASILNSLDNKIDFLHRQNKTLEQLAETLFRQWFIEDKNMNTNGKLKDLVNSANTGLDAIRRAPIVEYETGKKCLRIQDISQNKIFERWGNTKVKDSDYLRFQLKRNDIIMARTCSPGINYLVRQDLPAVYNNGLVRIRAIESKVHPILLYYLFRTREFIAHIYAISGGTSVQLNMQIGELLNYGFSFPSLDEQDKIIDSFTTLDMKITRNNHQILALSQLRDTLLPQLMSRQIQVK